ncbi:hypothetical protein GWA97_06020 [Flavobacterium sp. LaA7.5]|nr:hypothetical protein [Flavobacterium salilacus subsp. altitudinum]
MKVILLLLCVAITGVSYGQDTLQTGSDSDKAVITLSLLSPTITYAPRYNFGYMHRFTNRWWVGIEAGYGDDASAISMTQGSDNNFFFDDYKLFEIRPEIFYSLNKNPKLKHLVSAEYFYIRHTDYFTTERYREIDTNSEYRFDAADYKRIKTGVNINYTLLFYFTEKFGLLSKTGFGVKRRNVTFSNVKNPVYVDTASDDEDWFGTVNHLEDAGIKTNSNFNFDLKLFYKL